MKKIIMFFLVCAISNSVLASELRCKKYVNDRPIRAKAKAFKLFGFQNQNEISRSSYTYEVENPFKAQENNALEVNVTVSKELPSNEIKITYVGLEILGNEPLKSDAKVFSGSRILGTSLTIGKSKVGIECSVINNY